MKSSTFTHRFHLDLNHRLLTMNHLLAKTVYDVSGRIALVTGGGTGM